MDLNLFEVEHLSKVAWNIPIPLDTVLKEPYEGGSNIR